MRILDFHCHLGNILELGGQALIEKSVPFRVGFDPDGLFRALKYHGQGVGDWLYSHIRPLKRALTRAERRRNGASTLENLMRVMDGEGIMAACVMPIAPYVPFEAVRNAAEKQPRLLPFGCVDFEGPDIAGQVARQRAAGALGFKFHPILQRTDPLGERAEAFLSACPEGTIVLVHVGISTYYPPEQADRERPEYGAAGPIVEMAARHPGLHIVAAHGGLQEHTTLIEGLKRVENLYVDTSFCQSSRLKLLYAAAGRERLLFASDWPYGFAGTSFRCLKEAFGRDGELMERILYGNGVALLKGANPGWLHA